MNKSTVAAFVLLDLFVVALVLLLFSPEARASLDPQGATAPDADASRKTTIGVVYVDGHRREYMRQSIGFSVSQSRMP